MMISSKKNAMLDINYLSLASAMHRLTEPAIRSALSALETVPSSLGLDAACGNGDHSLRLAQALSPHGRIAALDICREGLFRARASSARAGLTDRLAFLQGDLRCLPFPDHAFDWAWCADSLWPGPKSLGFLGMDPLPILRELVRVVRPGGLIAILFWSSQRLLPGHPFLEARLNATRAACYPFEEEWGYRDHILSAPIWLQEAGLEEIRGETFAADLLSPFSSQARDDLAACFQMLWGRALPELSDGDQMQFERLCSKDSPDFIADRPGYYAFITYTLFFGLVPSCQK
ncbi:MAG: class I SAM-dependent methyltransferase [Methanothrix sp.]|nr:class I SAM-dependent methyltransferase [Methanothrix sp.]